MDATGFRQKSVKILDQKPHEKRRGELYNILGKYGIFPLKMHSGKGVFFPIIGESDLEEILKKEVKEYALEKGFDIKTPIEYTAMKTVIIKEMDSIVDEYNDEEIKENIESVNSWAKVVEIYKFQTTTKMMKIQFESTAMANRADKEGMIILFQRIPPKRIEKEIFVKLMPCNNCFKYDHETKNCTEEKKILCAYCGSDGHKQSSCVNPDPKCLNCGEAHRTLAAQCKVRKELIKTKRKEIRQRSRSRSRSQVRLVQPTGGTTYAETLGGGTRRPQQQQGEETINITSDPNMERLTTIIMSAVVYSTYMETINPGSFHENMDYMYEANGLQKVKFPKKIKVQGMRKLYQDIFKVKVAEEAEYDDEAFEDPAGDATDMDVEQTSKRFREPSASPKEAMETKKKKETATEEPKEQRMSSSLKIKPQDKPPIPPPAMQVQKIKQGRKQENLERETSETEIADRLKKEREASARPRTSSQSSVTSMGSSGGTSRTARDMNIIIYAQESDYLKAMFAKTLTMEDKEIIIRALLKGRAKIQWNHPQVKKEQLIAALEKKQIDIEKIKFKMVNAKEYWSIKEQSTPKI